MTRLTHQRGGFPSLTDNSCEACYGSFTLVSLVGSAAPRGGITGYTRPVAKVMISLPDDLLARLDAQAAAHGSTRSGTIRDLAEAALGERERLLAARMSELEGHATGHGGNVVDQLKAGRPA